MHDPTPWTFLDYVDRHGVNRISMWLRSIPNAARVEFEALLGVLRVKPIMGRPQTGILHGQYRGLFEFVFKADKVQYRPLFCYGPDTKAREITILVGATKKDNKFIPPQVCKTGLNRKTEIQMDRKRIIRHVRA